MTNDDMYMDLFIERIIECSCIGNNQTWGDSERTMNDEIKIDWLLIRCITFVALYISLNMKALRDNFPFPPSFSLHTLQI